MKGNTRAWLHEGREFVANAEKKFTDSSSVNAGAVENLVKSYEYAIKAPIVEKYGTVPRRFQTHDLTSLCQLGGLSSPLPGNLQDAIREIETLYPVYPGEPAYTTLVSSSTSDQWNNRIKAANELLDFIDRKVICDSMVFSRLTF